MVEEISDSQLLTVKTPLSRLLQRQQISLEARHLLSKYRINICIRVRYSLAAMRSDSAYHVGHRVRRL